MQKKCIMKWAIPACIVLVAVVILAVVLKNQKRQYQVPENGLVAYTLTVQCGYDGNLRQWVDTMHKQTAYSLAMEYGYGESEENWESEVSDLAAGEQVDIRAAVFSEVGDLVLTMSDGVKVNLGKAKGESEIRVSGAKKNEQGQLEVTYTDGKVVNLGAMVALSGEENILTDVGICSVTVSSEGKLELTLTNGTTMDMGSIG